jgi:hypothetical protein
MQPTDESKAGNRTKYAMLLQQKYFLWCLSRPSSGTNTSKVLAKSLNYFVFSSVAIRQLLQNHERYYMWL